MRYGRSARSRWLVCFTVALAVIASGGLDAPLTTVQTESAIDGIEAEEIVTEERRAQTRRRRTIEDRPLVLANPVCVAPTEVDAALAAHAAAAFERETGRHRRHRHKSLLI